MIGGLRGWVMAAGLAICAGAPPAQAATVTPSGVKNLEVVFAGGSKLYDVAFGDGTCIALFDGCDANSDFPFPDADLRVAMQALADVLNAGFTFGSGFRPAGCTASGNCAVLTPSFLIGPDVVGSAIVGFISVNWTVTGFVLSLDDDTTSIPNGTYATWTEVAPIPLPASGVLMVAGLAGLAALRRRARRAA
jgi:hypothetical protein